MGLTLGCYTSPLRNIGVQNLQISSVKRDEEERVCNPLIKYDAKEFRVSIVKFFIRCELSFRF